MTDYSVDPERDYLTLNEYQEGTSDTTLENAL